MQAGMGIQDIGSDSDYYRRKDRKAALAVSKLAGTAECLPHLLVLAMQKLTPQMDEAESFHDQLETLAQTPAVRTTAGIDLKQAIASLTSEPAEVIGVDTGNLSVGATADICIFDPDQHWTLEADNMVSRGHNSPFLGWELRGKVCHTVIGGEVIYSVTD